MSTMKIYHPLVEMDSSHQILRKGIFDDEDSTVYLTREKDFAFLCPSPSVDYKKYKNRVSNLGLDQYKKNKNVNKKRMEKVYDIFNQTGIDTVLEIGASDGLFLKVLKDQLPNLRISAVEKDDITLESRREIVGKDNCFSTLDELIEKNREFDIICFFHVFEHIKEVLDFLKKIKILLAPNGRVLIEVPSLDDPLLSIYHSDPFEKFYFQKQHPFVYSASSLERTLEKSGFSTIKTYPYQRYGLENHIGWLINKEPGGSKLHRKLFSAIEKRYKEILEEYGKTDTVFWLGRL